MTRPAPNAIPRELRWRGKEIAWSGRTLSGAQWAREFGVKSGTFYARLNSGWSMQRIKSTPVTPNGRMVRGAGPTVLWPNCVPRRINSNLKCHSVVRAIYNAMNKERCTYKMMSSRSGVSTSAIMAMRRCGPGYFSNVEAMANVVSLKIEAVG